MKIKSFLPVILVLLFNFSLFSQTPLVETKEAGGVSVSFPSAGNNSIYNISATLYGNVNANGTSCTVSFQYGSTTNYGNTVSYGTVSGSTTTYVSAAAALTNATAQPMVIHYRLVVSNSGGTFYGRDFIAVTADPARNINISPICSDSPTMATFTITNNNNFVVSVGYSAGSYSGTVITLSLQTQNVNVGKSSVCAFTYNYTIFNQVVTDDSVCSSVQPPGSNIFAAAVGEFYPGMQLFRLENNNAFSVDISITAGTTTYNLTLATGSVNFFAVPKNEIQISYLGTLFCLVSATNYEMEMTGWVTLTPLTSTPSTAKFELYNRDNAAHTFTLRNASGTEYSYTLSADSGQVITLPNGNWDVYSPVYDPTDQVLRPDQASLYTTGPVYGDTSYENNDKIKIATASPGSSISASITSVTAASSSSESVAGTFSNSAFVNDSVTYYVAYGTDTTNLNRTTSVQNAVVPASGTLNVSTTVTGLNADSLNYYYFKLVVDSTVSSSPRSLPLNASIPQSNLVLHLRSDAAVTSSSSLVSQWGDVSGKGNNAV